MSVCPLLTIHSSLTIWLFHTLIGTTNRALYFYVTIPQVCLEHKKVPWEEIENNVVLIFKTETVHRCRNQLITGGAQPTSRRSPKAWPPGTFLIF